MEDHFIVEVIDPETLEPVSKGVDGELVFTSLTKEAMPVIRYRTGDIASLDKTPCLCGRTTVRMSRVKGRIDDMLIIRGVNIFPSEIENVLLSVDELAPHYQLMLTRHGPLDEVVLNVEINPETFAAFGGDLNLEGARDLAARVARMIKNACLVTVEVHLMPPGSIPRSEGKAVRVVDKRAEAAPRA